MGPLPLAAVDGPLALLVGGVLLLCGLLALACFAGATIVLQRWRRLRQSSPEEFRASLAGPIELVGVARPTEDGDSFHAAVSGTESLICDIEAQVYQSSGQGGGSWTTKESRTTSRPFLVDTQAGLIRVEPEGADLVLETQTVDQLDGGEEATGRTAAFLDAVGVERTTGSVNLGITKLDYGTRCRIRESRLDVGEEVYVAGTARTDDPAIGGYAGPDAVVRAVADRSLSERLFGFPFVIGDEGEAGVLRHFFRRGLIFLTFGILFSAVCAAIVYFVFLA